jgi:PGF-pre-PGF domain-containing protein
VRSITNKKNKGFFNNRHIKKIFPCYLVILIILGTILSVGFLAKSATIGKLTGSGDETLISNDESSSTDTSLSSDNTQTSSDTSSSDTSSSDDISSTSSQSTSSDDTTKFSDSSTSYDDSTYSDNQNTSSIENTLNSSSLNFDMSDDIYVLNERIVPEDEIISLTEKNFGDISTNQEVELITENSLDIKTIKFTPSSDLNDVKVSIIKLKDKPEVIKKPEKKNITIYKYLDIKLTTNEEYVEDSEIRSLKFKFNVQHSWIEENNIDKLTVELLRFHDGEWQYLTTSYIDEDKAYLYYEAESLGCSTFAIVGSKVIEKQESNVNKEASIPWSIIIAVIISLSAILIGVLIKARYIYVDENSDEDKKE